MPKKSIEGSAHNDTEVSCVATWPVRVRAENTNILLDACSPTLGDNGSDVQEIPTLWLRVASWGTGCLQKSIPGAMAEEVVMIQGPEGHSQGRTLPTVPSWSRSTTSFKSQQLS